MSRDDISLEINYEVEGIDLDNLIDKLEDEIHRGMYEFADRIEEVWRDKAGQTLHATKEEYLKGLSVEKTKDGASVTLEGWLPVALEQGTPRFDMKPGFLKSTNQGPMKGPVKSVGNRRIIPMGRPNTGFRTVSTNTPDNKFWHPGLQAKKISEQVKKEVPKISEEIFGPIISRIKV